MPQSSASTSSSAAPSSSTSPDSATSKSTASSSKPSSSAPSRSASPNSGTLNPTPSSSTSSAPVHKLAPEAEPVGFQKRIRLPTRNLSILYEERGALDVDSYLSTVDANYPQLEAADARRRIASARRLEVQGVFDPTISTLNGYTWMQNTSKFSTLKKVIFNQPILELPTRSGIRLISTYRYNPLAAQSPYIETGRIGEFAGGLAVPLLRGLIVNERETTEKVAKLGEPLATQNFTQVRLDILLRASLSYWNWVGAERKTIVARRLVQLSNTLIAAAKRRADAGDLPRIEVTEAEEDLQRRKADLIAIELEFKKAIYDIGVFLFDSSGKPLPWLAEENVPADWPTPAEYSDIELQKSIANALNRRPELRRINLQKDQAKLQVRLAKNNILPQADALYTQGYDPGSAGIGNVFRAQVQFSQPLYVRAARGQIKSAEFNVDALIAEERAEKQRIVAEVMSAAAAINAAHQRYLTLQIQTEKAEQVYRGEKKRFDVGDSTVFLVTQRERQLFDAKIRLVDTQIEYLQAVARMQVATVSF